MIPYNCVFDLKCTVRRSIVYLPCLAFYHQIVELDGEELLPAVWYRAAYAKIIKLSPVLKDLKQIDGKLINRNDNSVITDDYVISHNRLFNSIAKMFVRPISLQFSRNNTIPQPVECSSPVLFSKPSERDSIIVDSLTKICDFLNVSVQKRKFVRLAVCPQVTQRHIWRGALEEIFGNLKQEMHFLPCCSKDFQMSEQILSNCVKFLTEIKDPSSYASPSWMRPAPLNKVVKMQPSRNWEELLEMIDDLLEVLGKENNFAHHVSRLEMMKKGLFQIKDIIVERDITHKEVRRQDCLLQKKLTKSLGHSSKCLFILLQYYLHGTVEEIEIEVCGGLHRYGGKTYLCMGKFLTFSDEESIMSAIMQLNKVLSVFKFVWETAAMEGVLVLQGHVWCPDVDERSLTYRGNVYYLHGIRFSSSFQ
ncbi:uncharacterized protein LOC122046556 [Zingiber officinale]|uniref:Uncharacterized protein n=1 Tax=Zingiber officinale TaxID=94328 RepID=A0A8J5HCM9_ZINOF|nr:uncharacterized protein LOC122046556 [Zingiber officinale]XP_042463242.1 uncharacterized protein LOC122046556 [Zingiber officinale]KAG6525070.1 hypothetical protein ZIOFF_015022 [Zingiber officinale]